jgi:hypothetical protein
LHKGIRRFQERQPRTASVPDVAHHAANLLQHYWEGDAHWLSFTQRISETAAAIRQTGSAYLLAPSLRNKARYLSVGKFVRFGRMVLRKLRDAEPSALVVRRYGWVSEYAEALSIWDEQDELVQAMLRQVRVEGLLTRGEAVLDEEWERLRVSDNAVTVALRNRLRA